jgi:hypothetical protein
MIDRRRVCAASARKCKEARVRPSQGVPGQGGPGQGESGQGESGDGAADPCSDVFDFHFASLQNSGLREGS